MQPVESLYVYPSPPFSLHALSSRFKLARSTEFRLFEGEKALLMVVHLPDSEPNALMIAEEDDGDKCRLQLVRYAPNDRPRPDVLARCYEVLSLSFDSSSFLALVAEDKPMANLVQAKSALRPVSEPSLFAAVVKTILGQQLNTAFAGELVRRLVTFAGGVVHVGNHPMPLFPSPQALAVLDYQDLQSLQLSRRKAEYILDFARAVAEKEFNLASLARQTDEEAIERLAALRGFGRWTAENILVFGLARPDVFPVGDAGLLNGLRRVYQLPQRPTPKEALYIAERWRPFRTAATFYLWDALVD